MDLASTRGPASAPWVATSIFLFYGGGHLGDHELCELRSPPGLPPCPSPSIDTFVWASFAWIFGPLFSAPFWIFGPINQFFAFLISLCQLTWGWTFSVILSIFEQLPTDYTIYYVTHHRRPRQRLTTVVEVAPNYIAIVISPFSPPCTYPSPTLPPPSLVPVPQAQQSGLRPPFRPPFQIHTVRAFQ